MAGGALPVTGHRLLEHTADIGIEAWGASRAELFVAAARGLLEVLWGPRPPAAEHWSAVQVEGGDREELLVNWLQELLFRLEVERFLATDFVIGRISDTGLSGRLGGVTLVPGRHRLAREVKAVTWHRLEVAGAPGAWRACLYLDL